MTTQTNVKAEFDPMQGQLYVEPETLQRTIIARSQPILNDAKYVHV